MKKYLPIIILVVVLGAGGAYMLRNKYNNSKPLTSDATNQANKTGVTTSTTYKPIKACDAITLEDAKQVIGDTTTKGDTNADSIVETTELVLTHCTFITTDGAIPPKTSSVSLQARSAKTAIGATSNAAVFNPAVRPAGAETVDGLGEAAFWNPEFGQLSIFKNNNYYIVEAGPSKVSNRTLADAKKLADLIIDRL